MSRVRSPSPAPTCYGCLLLAFFLYPSQRRRSTSGKTLNEVYSSLSARRRYEVWFVRVGLADSAWWFRYLLMNPGRGGCPSESRGMPAQVWATWFPPAGKPQSFIQGYGLADLELSHRGENPFHFRIAHNEIGEDLCRGELSLDDHQISWELRYRSTFRCTLSQKGWIGFSRTPHSDAVFSGQILFDGHKVSGDPLGFGVQGHNCGYRHRSFWTWAHAYFPRPGEAPSTLEALVYDMPFGLVFRKAVLWHDRKKHEFGNLRETMDREGFCWSLGGSSKDGIRFAATIEGSGPNLHRLPYLKTDCSGTFEVSNNSLAKAVLRLERDGRTEELQTSWGAVLEMAGR